MTADIELLPLPDKVEVDKHLPTGVRIYAYDATTLKNYARANVEHHTAPLQAEIEALRAEVAAVWNAMPSGTRYLDPPDGGDVPLHEQVRRMAADAVRAEHLAEALREARRALAWAAERLPEIAPQYEAADSALRDHDQEEK